MNGKDNLVHIALLIFGLSGLTNCAHCTDNVTAEPDAEIPAPFLIREPVFDQPDSEDGVVLHKLTVSGKTHPRGWIHDPENRACKQSILFIKVYDSPAQKREHTRPGEIDTGFNGSWDKDGVWHADSFTRDNDMSDSKEDMYVPPPFVPYADESYLNCLTPDGTPLTPQDLPFDHGYWTYIRFPKIDPTWHVFDYDDMKQIHEEERNGVMWAKEYYSFKIGDYFLYVSRDRARGYDSIHGLDISIHTEHKECDGVPREEWKEKGRVLAEPFREMDMVIRPKAANLRPHTRLPWWYAVARFQFLNNQLSPPESLHINSAHSQLFNRTRCVPPQASPSIYHVVLPPPTQHATYSTASCRRAPCEL